MGVVCHFRPFVRFEIGRSPIAFLHAFSDIVERGSALKKENTQVLLSSFVVIQRCLSKKMCPVDVAITSMVISREGFMGSHQGHWEEVWQLSILKSRLTSVEEPGE
jgi:hypothetical protein